ncbi:MAG: NUMOD4 domain-containing protein [Bacteroidota bacterium]
MNPPTNSDYPYTDTSTVCLPDENWKPVPYYEGYYEVSDLGRVRSLDRVIPHPRLNTQFVKGRVLKQKVIYHNNTLSDQPMVDLQVSLSKDGGQHYRNVRRLVYSAFIKHLSYEEDKMYVINIDCNGFNNRLDNVKAVSIKDKSRRAFQRNRVPESYLSYADRSQWENYGGYARRKPIEQLDEHGNLIAHYESVREASRRTGIGEKEIISTAKGRYRKWKGFIWRYAK